MKWLFNLIKRIYDEDKWYIITSVLICYTGVIVFIGIIIGIHIALS